MVITAVVLSIAHGGDEKTMSDREIIKRAEELGMVQEQRDLLAEASGIPTAAEEAEPTITGESQTEEPQSDSEGEETKGQVTEGADKNFTDDILAMATEVAKPSKEAEPTRETEPTKEPVLTNAAETITPTQQPTATPEPTKSVTPTSAVSEKRVLTIVSGMWSDQVARELQNMGVVESATDFDQFLMENGYANRIVVGTFEIPENASYEEIAQIITNRKR